MKDLYSAHATEEEMMAYYEKVKETYLKIFKRLGLEVKVIEAGGGVFTEKRTHEFQVLADGGEDTIYYCEACDWGENKEIFKGRAGEACPKCKKGKIIEARSIEVANIFPLGTWYSEKMAVYFSDKDGQKKPVWFASYGIGPTRILGTFVEVFHDEKGIIWPKEVAPYQAHLINLKTQNTKLSAGQVYQELVEAGVEVLYDDREVSAGVKFADADLIGIPVRLVVSEKTQEKIEWKERDKEKEELLSFDEVVNRLKHGRESETVPR